MASAVAAVARRRPEIDWLRGLAVLCMVLWHVVDAWHRPAGRDTAAFAVVVFFAGWAAPMFLFFAGVSVPLAGQARLSRGHDRSGVVRSLIRRGWQVFLLAHLFRLQSLVLSSGSNWSALFKPDILNVLGLGLILVAWLWGHAQSRRAEVGLLLIPAVVVAVVVTPWVRDWWWPSLLPPRLEGYIRIRNGNAVFSLFPALAYMFAGAFTGMFLSRGAARPVRTTLLGVGLLGVALGSRYVPLSAAWQEWLEPGLIVALRIGAMLIALVAAERMLRSIRLPASDPLLVLGRASLVVYWVHVELAYGSISASLHRALTLPRALGGFLLVTATMYLFAFWWTRVSRRRAREQPPTAAAAEPQAGPGRALGSAGVGS